MVGVPGRSKACLTCRRRRKGCDGARPNCSQCIAAGLECAGYARQTIFVNWTEGDTPVAYSRRDREGNTTNARQTARDGAVARQQAGGAMRPLLHGLTRTAYVERYNGLFWSQFLPHGKKASARANDHCGSEGFLLVAESMYTSQPAVQRVLLALSLSTVGRSNRDMALVHGGVRAYTSTVQSLANMIASGLSMGSDVALILVKGLNTFEIMFGEDHAEIVAQSRKLISHIEGEIAMLEARGPASLQTGDAHEMLVVGRLFLLVSNIRTRKRSFLHSPEWMSVPWLVIPKNPRDRLVDIMFEVAGLLEDIDSLQAAASNGDKNYETLRLDIADACWQLDERLQRWSAEDAPVVSFYDSAGSFREAWDPDDYARADMVQVYWSACLLLYELMGMVVDDPQSLPARCDPLVYLRKIGETLPVIWTAGAGIIATARGTFPMGVALYVLYSHPYTDPEIIGMFARLRARPDVQATLGPFMDSLVAELVTQKAPRLQQDMVTRTRTSAPGATAQ
ncbi:uncharacterized protein B0I36DRAFT_335488 [Microdochium trichocladiopsis]|uniref:Zn(2)-C6 fungal-type domain-containing protein n=1 Tax=Microdochium trichocladiopsis TaxID=1682393 RepID=A0A9P8XU73_9PEZI|nr:uncharacterized protein B0I36DRAFT_335488 [Microdochium trichocladiopsis]KAH7018202.1 hypothetical protein B0I36DRAFT_335488 [Microdochium trichocladiopsis]